MFIPLDLAKAADLSTETDRPAKGSRSNDGCSGATPPEEGGGGTLPPVDVGSTLLDRFLDRLNRLRSDPKKSRFPPRLRLLPRSIFIKFEYPEYD